MPKASGSSMKTVRLQPQPTSRAIKSFDQPAPGGGAPKHADRITASEKSWSGGIDPRQQPNSDPSNID